MKNMVVALAALLVAFAAKPLAAAAAGPAPGPGDFKLQQASSFLQITGEVKSVQQASGTVVVAKKFGEKVIEVAAVADAETVIVKGAARKGLGDIKAGDKVVLIYVGKDGVNRVKSITLK